MIAIIDYGMGNLRSVQKALETVGGRAKIVSTKSGLSIAEKIILPGVGAFGDAMKELRRLKLVEPIKEAIREGKTFLGLCLGLQLLFETSAESPGVKGLGILKGRVKRFEFRNQKLKVPHMGWNNIKLQITNYKLQTNPKSKILTNVPDGSYMYFVHSYYAEPKDKSVILATTDYGINFASGIWKDNIYAFQFHPEKSQKIGLQILKNFVSPQPD